MLPLITHLPFNTNDVFTQDAVLRSRLPDSVRPELNKEKRLVLLLTRLMKLDFHNTEYYLHNDPGDKVFRMVELIDVLLANFLR